MHICENLGRRTCNVPQLHFIDSAVKKMAAISRIPNAQWQIKRGSSATDRLRRDGDTIEIESHGGAVANQRNVEPLTNSGGDTRIQPSLTRAACINVRLQNTIHDRNFEITITNHDRAPRI